MTLYGMLVLIWMEKVQVYQKVQIKNLTEVPVPPSKEESVRKNRDRPVQQALHSLTNKPASKSITAS